MTKNKIINELTRLDTAAFRADNKKINGAIIKEPDNYRNSLYLIYNFQNKEYLKRLLELRTNKT